MSHHTDAAHERGCLVIFSGRCDCLRLSETAYAREVMEALPPPPRVPSEMRITVRVRGDR